MARLPLTLLVLGAAVALAAPAHADGFLVPKEPGRPVAGGWSITTERVDAGVRGANARVTVEQTFVNHGSSTLEADLVVPLPPNVVAGSVALIEGDAPLESRLLAGAEGRAAYDALVRRQRDPALLAHAGRDAWQVGAFSLAPGQERRVRLRYEQALGTSGGAVSLRLPLEGASLSAQPLRALSVRVTVETSAAVGPVYSPSHEVEVVRAAPQRFEAVHEGRGTRPDGDFVLHWAAGSGPVAAALLTWWPADEERGTFLLLAAPTGPPPARAVAAKQITFVVDTSASMAGDKLEQVRGALAQVVEALEPTERFNLIAYDTTVRALWAAPRPVGRETRAEALAFVRNLAAGGYSDVAGALAAALGPAPAAGVPEAIVFITDGRPTVGVTDAREILARVREANRARGARLYVFGVGVDVNAVLLDRLALDNGGTPSYVLPRGDVAAQVASLFAALRRPALTDVTIDLGALRPGDVLPARAPDLQHGGTVVVAGRYAQAGRREVVLAGREGAVAREFHLLLDVPGRGAGLADDFPARVWATRRIAALLDEARLGGRRDVGGMEEVVRLSTRYGLPTEYTAFLADEGVDLHDVSANARRATQELEAQVLREEGGSGVAQALNNVGRRGADRAGPAPRVLVPAAGDRDVRDVPVEGVRQVGNRTFYRRGPAWIDVRAPSSAAAERIVRWSPRFEELLRAASPEEQARLALPGEVLLQVGGRVVRLVEDR